MEMNIKRSTRLRAQKIDPARAGAVASVSLRASPGRAGQRKSTTATASARGAPVIASKIEKRNRRRRNFSSRHQGYRTLVVCRMPTTFFFPRRPQPAFRGCRFLASSRRLGRA